MMIVDGRGKLGGHVLSKNRSGAYARTKVTPVNPQTSFQLAARTLLTAYSQAWAALTQAERNLWNGAVQAFARTNIFGDIVNPTGKNLFSRLAINVSLTGGTPATEPPLVTSAGDIVAGTVIAVNGGAKSVTYTSDTTPDFVQVWVTPSQSVGKKFVKNQYRLLVTQAPGASPIVFTTAYNARFGDVTTGQRLWVKLVPMNADGIVGQASESSVIAT